MPELPEVETTRRGLERVIVGRTIASLLIRERRLRWPVGKRVAAELEGRRIGAVERRGKYLLVNVEHGALLVHLGMSGSLRYLASPAAPRRHDHVDLCLVGGGCVRFNDPRRFGSLHFATDPERHPLLKNLGPEPLGDEFTVDYLHATCRGRRVAIKHHLMNSRVVVGVGNIYANEALFRARIHPARAAGRISRARLTVLVDRLRDVLRQAVERGGTTLRDYVDTDGTPGYFKLELDVYDREGMACKSCGAPIRRVSLGQRAAFFCVRCQR
ncbi:MAG TPA: bifunctional DNA-formamidopyrimidine glycosylase/DNA-(apurinic or apyrimidinic site) lyase [Gammaproteobacteria bacterium]|jgi:formamidopyrimidine-DNA glycosylase